MSTLEVTKKTPSLLPLTKTGENAMTGIKQFFTAYNNHMTRHRKRGDRNQETKKMKSFGAIINPETPPGVLEKLRDHVGEILFVPPSDDVAPPLKGHADLQLFICHDKIFCRCDMPSSFIKSLRAWGEVYLCHERPGPAYPEDIPFNVAFTGAAAFHRIDKTEKDIVEHLSRKGIPLINVAQGYSRCSTCIVSEKHIITADAGIDAAAKKAGIESLLIEAGHVRLPGYRYGFIGGASGLCEDRLFLTGSLESHPHGKAMKSFIARAGVEIVSLSEGPLIDVGSIFFITKTK